MTPCTDRDRLTPSRRHDPLPPFLRSPSWPVDVRQLADVVHLDATSPAKRAAAIAQVHDDFRAVVGGQGPCRSVVEAILAHSFWYPLEGHTAERRHQRSLTNCQCNSRADAGKTCRVISRFHRGWQCASLTCEKSINCTHSGQRSRT